MRAYLSSGLLLFSLLFVSCSSSSSDRALYHKFRSVQKSHLTKDGQLKYIDKGKGEVIVLLHGVPSSGWLYRKMVDGLVAEGYRVIVPDMLGFGSSDSPKGYEIYSPEEQASRLVSLMDKLGVKKWNHVFHDVGGTWTWELMRNHEHRVKRLIVLNSINLESGFYPPVRMEPGILAKSAMWGYKNGITTNLLLDRLFEEGVLEPDKLSKSDRAGYKVPLLEGKTNGMYYFFTKTCNDFPDYEEVITKMKTPTFVIWGKHDTMLRWEPLSNELMSKAKISERNVSLIEARHFIQEEQPELVNQSILKFLKR